MIKLGIFIAKTKRDLGSNMNTILNRDKRMKNNFVPVQSNNVPLTFHWSGCFTSLLKQHRGQAYGNLGLKSAGKIRLMIRKSCQNQGTFHQQMLLKFGDYSRKSK